jgi:hypothetical protein
MLKAVAHRAAVRTSSADIIAERAVQTLDREIDELVYRMYGLTDQEIRVVEESFEERTGADQEG